MVKFAKKIDESHDIGQPAAEGQLLWPSRIQLVTRGYEPLLVQGEQKAPRSVFLRCSGEGWPHGDESLFVQGGAEDTDERVLAWHTEVC